MSDPTARRGDIISALLNEMRKSKRGWRKEEVKTFLFERYRFGVREETLEAIFMQLKDRLKIRAKPIKKDSSILLWYPVDEAQETQPE
ncbi:MAG: hypothetical protein QXM22_05225 [Candidatus Bathyarchaeia archaeon]